MDKDKRDPEYSRVMTPNLIESVELSERINAEISLECIEDEIVDYDDAEYTGEGNCYVVKEGEYKGDLCIPDEDEDGNFTHFIRMTYAKYKGDEFLFRDRHYTTRFTEEIINAEWIKRKFEYEITKDNNKNKDYLFIKKFWFAPFDELLELESHAIELNTDEEIYPIPLSRFINEFSLFIGDNKILYNKIMLFNLFIQYRLAKEKKLYFIIEPMIKYNLAYWFEYISIVWETWTNNIIELQKKYNQLSLAELIHPINVTEYLKFDKNRQHIYYRPLDLSMFREMLNKGKDAINNRLETYDKLIDNINDLLFDIVYDYDEAKFEKINFALEEFKNQIIINKNSSNAIVNSIWCLATYDLLLKYQHETSHTRKIISELRMFMDEHNTQDKVDEESSDGTKWQCKHSELTCKQCFNKNVNMPEDIKKRKNQDSKKSNNEGEKKGELLSYKNDTKYASACQNKWRLCRDNFLRKIGIIQDSKKEIIFDRELGLKKILDRVAPPSINLN